MASGATTLRLLGKLGFIGVAQSAGFKLREIKELIDGADGLGTPMRSHSRQKLSEVEALLESTKAMKGWLEVAREYGCATPCRVRPPPCNRRGAPGRRAGAPNGAGERQGLSPAARGLNARAILLALRPLKADDVIVDR